MKYYLMDGTGYMSAAKDYIPTLTTHIFNRAAAKEVFIYMPQFAVTDVLRRYTKLLMVDKKIKEDKYKNECALFIDRIRSRKIIYVYDLHRYHNLNAKDYEIYKIFWQNCIKNKMNKDEQKFGAQHVLTVAMAIELKKQHIGRDDEMWLYTNTPTLSDVVAKFDIKIELQGNN